MGGPFAEAPYPSLTLKDFGPGSPYQATLHGRIDTIVIGDTVDPMLRQIHRRVRAVAGTLDIAIHGLPGRFIESINDPRWEIPATVIVGLLDSNGVRRGTPLRLLTCHGAETPRVGPSAAELLAREWRAAVSAPNGLLRIGAGGSLRVDLVYWEPVPWDPSRMQIDAQTVQVGGGTFVTVHP